MPLPLAHVSTISVGKANGRPCLEVWEEDGRLKNLHGKVCCQPLLHDGDSESTEGEDSQRPEMLSISNVLPTHAGFHHDHLSQPQQSSQHFHHVTHYHFYILGAFRHL